VKNTTIDDQDLRKACRHVLENTALGAVFEPRLNAVKTTSKVDPSDAVTDPLDRDFVPQDKTELGIAVQNIIKNTDDVKAGAVFRAFKTALNKQKGNETMNTFEKKLAKQAETVLRKQIRKMIREAGYEYYGIDTYGDPRGDEDEKSVETSQALSKKRKAYKTTAIGGMSDVEGASFADIAKELGLSVAGAKRAVDMALEKARYVATQYTKDEELEILVLQAIKDYIDHLNSTGELEASDVQLLNNNPEIVRELDGFREFLNSYIKRARKHND